MIDLSTTLTEPAALLVPRPGSGGARVGGNDNVQVRRYVRDDGWKTRYWAIYVGAELLAVVLYKKGAMAIAARIR